MEEVASEVLMQPAGAAGMRASGTCAPLASGTQRSEGTKSEKVGDANLDGTGNVPPTSS